jgi:putative ABC transport system permease protein
VRAFGFAAKRLLSHRLLTAFYILSIALAIGLLAAPSLFSDAVAQAIMRDELSERADAQRRPTFPVRFYAMPRSSSPLDLAQSEEVRAWLADSLSRGLGLSVRTCYVQNESPAFRLRALDDDVHYTQSDLTDAKVVVVPGIGDHLTTVNGAAYGSEGDGRRLQVWILPGFAEQLGLEVGEVFQLSYPIAAWGSVELQVAGIVQEADAQEEFWYQPAEVLFRKGLLTTEEQYATHVQPLAPEGTGYAFWYFVLDDAQLNLSHATRYIEVLQRASYDVERTLPEGRMDVAPLDELLRARERKRDLSLVLTALTVPMLVVLVQFLVIVSSIYAQTSARHDATLVSRGASKSQLLLLTLGEAALCLLLAIPLGLGMAIWLARILGLADGFLSFGTREVLPVYLAAVDWLPVAVAVAIGVVARLWATAKHAALSLIAYERQAAGRVVAMTGLRLVLLGFLGVVAWYAYRQLAAAGGVPIVLTADAVTFSDPLLLLAPSLFLVVAPLLLAETASLLVGLVARLLDPLLPAPLLLALRQLARQGSRSRAPVFLLVTSLALGVFYASVAHSSQIWARDRLQHTVGADLTFDHAVVEDEMAGGVARGSDAWHLPAQDYEAIEGVERATRIGSYSGRTRLGGRGEQRIRLVGIERMSFPAVAYFRPDYAEVPLGELMNLLALEPQGALVPQAIADERGLLLGDPLTVSYRLEDKEEAVTLSYQLVGTYDYFPTVEDGELAIVVNIETLFEGAGQLMPHSIWMRTGRQADVDAIMAKIEALGVVPARPRVLAEMRKEAEDRREYVGTLGMMSVSFLASLLVAAVGTLVHLFAGLMQRRGTLAMLRGIGFRLRDVSATILVEYLVIIGEATAGGALIGLAASELYGRYLPLAAPSIQALPPFIAYNDTSTTWLMAVSMLVTTMTVVALAFRYLRRQRVFEALRMG